MRLWLAAAALVILATGCDARLSQDLASQRALFQAEQAARMENLDRLESRLIEARARDLAWQELARRHRHVSAVTCKNLSSHVQAMERYQARQIAKAKRLRAERVAALARRDSELQRLSQRAMHPPIRN